MRLDHLLSKEEEVKVVLLLSCSDCSLQLDYMKLESLVIANQNVAVNAFPGLVHTARHTTEVGGAQSWSINRLPKAKPMTGVKS